VSTSSVQTCSACGAGLALEDLRAPNCRYCNTVLPHHARAMQQVQVINQVMAGGMFGVQGQQVQMDYDPRQGPSVQVGGSPFLGGPFVHPMQMQHASAKAGRTITILVLSIVFGSFALVAIGMVVAVYFGSR
jgi:hypothetical protein